LRMGKADIGLEVLALGLLCFFVAFVLAILLYTRSNLMLPHW
jgi:hypothetical protein